MALREEHGPVPDPASDDRIRSTIDERLRAAVPDEEVVVEVKGGIVTLRGDVDGPEEVRAATQACRGVDGVQRIVDLLRPRVTVPTTH